MRHKVTKKDGKLYFRIYAMKATERFSLGYLGSSLDHAGAIIEKTDDTGSNSSMIQIEIAMKSPQKQGE